MYTLVKGVFDLVLAMMVTVVLSPLLLILCLLLLCTGEHKVFYLQKRIGYKNQPFFIYKFATMLQNSPYGPRDQRQIKSVRQAAAFGPFWSAESAEPSKGRASR